MVMESFLNLLNMMFIIVKNRELRYIVLFVIVFWCSFVWKKIVMFIVVMIVSCNINKCKLVL